jgi:hypothetical protein
MYEYRGLQDIIFISLYCGVAFLAVVACLYLLLRRGNAFVGDDFKTSRRLRLATFYWEAAVGLVPWASDYYSASGFSVTNLSLRAAKDIKITDSFSLPLFGQLVANPAS